MPDERLSEQRLLFWAKLVCIGVILSLIVFVIVLDPILHPDKPINDVVLGLLIGSLFALLGIGGLERLAKRNGS